MGKRSVPFILRTLFIFFVLVCLAMGLCSSSFAESSICFRDIPWLSSENQVLQALKKQGIISDDVDTDELRRDLIQPWEPFAGCEYPDGVEIKYYSKLAYDRVPQTDYFIRGSYSYLEHGNNPICQVAGYDVSVVRIYFLPKVKKQTNGQITYDTSNLMFVRAGYNIDNLYYGKADEVYLDLQTKLTSLYGDPIESNDVILGTYWHSPDGSGVQLWEFSNSVYIVYAYYDDEAIVAELNGIQHSIDDAEETKKRDSTDGL